MKTFIKKTSLFLLLILFSSLFFACVKDQSRPPVEILDTHATWTPDSNNRFWN